MSDDIEPQDSTATRVHFTVPPADLARFDGWWRGRTATRAKAIRWAMKLAARLAPPAGLSREAQARFIRDLNAARDELAARYAAEKV